MPKTSLELITRSLQRLNVLGAGQGASAEDAQVVRDQIVPLLEELAQREVYFVQDIEAIPEKDFLALANRLAAEVAPDFGLGSVGQDAIIQLENRLKRLWAMKPLYGPQRTTYF